MSQNNIIYHIYYLRNNIIYHRPVVLLLRHDHPGHGGVRHCPVLVCKLKGSVRRLSLQFKPTLMALLGPLNWKWYQYSTRRDTRPRMKPVQAVQYTVQYSTVQYSTVQAQHQGDGGRGHPQQRGHQPRGAGAWQQDAWVQGR